MNTDKELNLLQNQQADSEPLCQRLAIKRGLPKPFLLTDEAMKSLRRKLLDSTNVDLEKARECVEWAGARDEWGYGRVVVKVDGKYRSPSASRMSYLVFRGPIPDGMRVCHKCDNPPCYNPNHLFLGSPSRNIQDSYDKGRQQYRPPCETIPKLYYEILADFRPYEFTRKMLAEKYGVPILHVNYVLKRAHRHGECPLREVA